MKRSFKLAEVCKQLDLPPYVLRYWETEFPALQASGNRASGPGRAYSVEEVAVLRRIKQLLYEEGYTIAGAKKKLESEPQPRVDPPGAGALFADGESEGSAPDAGDGEGAADDASTASRTAAPLDSSSGERIETLERGIADALKEARAILSLLDKQSR
jgi:DNA-binding transcriptional MerR regulator